jgi:hypothetical protein
MFVYKDSTFLAESVEASVPYLTGDRMSTLMFYLSDVEAGGVTAFPRLGVAAAPRLGSAIFWHNINRWLTRGGRGMMGLAGPGPATWPCYTVAAPFCSGPSLWRTSQ